MIVINHLELEKLRDNIIKFSEWFVGDINKYTINELINTLNLHIYKSIESTRAEENSKKFNIKPKLRDNFINENIDKLLYIDNEINKALSIYSGFDGIDFYDVGGKVFYIRGFHKEIWTASYGNLIAVEFDFSNMDQAISDFITMWILHDNSKNVETFKKFILEGGKHGWD